PGADGPIAGTARKNALEPAQIVRADRILDAFHLGRVGGAEGEQVEDNQPAAAPTSREADAAANRRIVVRSVGRGRVQHDEGGEARAGAARARQQVTTRAAGRGEGVSITTEARCRRHLRQAHSSYLRRTFGLIALKLTPPPISSSYSSSSGRRTTPS